MSDVEMSEKQAAILKAIVDMEKEILKQQEWLVEAFDIMEQEEQQGIQNPRLTEWLSKTQDSLSNLESFKKIFPIRIPNSTTRMRDDKKEEPVCKD